jgi:hypothetical protein
MNPAGTSSDPVDYGSCHQNRIRKKHVIWIGTDQAVRHPTWLMPAGGCVDEFPYFYMPKQYG